MKTKYKSISKLNNNKKLLFSLLLIICLSIPHPVSAKELTTKEAKSILNIVINKTYILLTSSSSPYIYPVDGLISSPYGPRESSIDGFHYGIDIAVAENSQVHCSNSGIIVKAEFNEMIGNVVYINHPDGKQTMYAHNNKLLVNIGDKVNQNDVIALSGNTGSRSTGSHVHFEIRTNNGSISVNPLDYLPVKTNKF